MKNNSRVVFVSRWLRGIKMDASSSPYLRFSVGTTLLIYGLSRLIEVLSGTGAFS
ncbi:hypothetical protein [Candidatus Sororendozoicomonas aggregata]|uniref:hypothetical protein n=1 Tax=Candidatus Sororendozoicomonas aggregata TaxID=3073239 RepID=UPI002ECFD9DE